LAHDSKFCNFCRDSFNSTVDRRFSAFSDTLAERTNERTNEQTNKRTNERTNDSFSKKSIMLIQWHRTDSSSSRFPERRKKMRSKNIEKSISAVKGGGQRSN
jgi:small-conductance mechanosensitive channel